jgi:hypothetical protein
MVTIDGSEKTGSFPSKSFLSKIYQHRFINTKNARISYYTKHA